MTIYEKNLKALAKHYPDMDKMLEQAKGQLTEDVEVMVEEAFDGECVLRVKKDGRSLYLNGRRDTGEIARIWAENQGYLASNATVFVWGVGNPFYLKELVERTENRITILVCEPSIHIFLKFLELIDIEMWLEKHLIVFWVYGLEGMEEKGLKPLLYRLITYESMPYSRTLILPNYEYLFPDETLAFVKMWNEVAKDRDVKYNTAEVFSAVLGKNILSNIRYLPEGYKTVQLVDVIPRDIPGIVVAAGPSLNKNIEELKKAKGKAFIIAVDTAIKPLINAGIIPDMFAIVDGLKPLLLIEKEEVKQIPLVTTINAASDVLSYHTGKKFFYNEGYNVVEKIMEKSKVRYGSMAVGGSVATMAFNLLYRIGVHRIILMGQDLALTGNKVHADGTFSDKEQEIDTTHYVMVEGNIEEQVPTRGDYKLYLDWYGDFIKRAQVEYPNFRVINATEGGAKIQGTEVMTLKDAIAQECTKDVDIKACLDKLPTMLDEDGKVWAKEYLKKIPQEFTDIASEAKKLQGLYQKLDKICNKRNIDQKEYLSILKRIEKNIKRIEDKDSYELIAFSMPQAHSIILDESYLKEKSVQEEGKEIARKGKIYVSCVQQCAELFLEYLENLENV